MDVVTDVRMVTKPNKNGIASLYLEVDKKPIDEILGSDPTTENKNLKTCPKCDKNMVLCFSGECLTVYPPMYLRHWRCGCGHEESGPSWQEQSAEQKFQEAWEAANR